MSASGDLIDFDIIENQKENIQSLPQGRSARNLAKIFSPSPLQPLSTPTPSDTRNLNDAVREEFEEELANIGESDDPLDIYDRYVKWTLDAYPSAQATPNSQLAPLLERATKTFLNSPQYKNDPRYLKLWLSYIRFFSDTPRETFAFLARHSIGEGLALFYEEFAGWLEGAGRWVQAEEVFQMGIDKEARPAPRLLRKFNEFQERFAARPESSNEPSSPALPTVRPALAAKIDPYAAVAPAPEDPQAPRPSAGVGGGSTTTKSGKQKLKIFSDDENGSAPAVSASPGAGWESIGSLADRKKENRIEPKPWVGETLKAGGKKSSTKIPIFKDESLKLPQITNPELQQVTINPRNGRSERIFVNLEAVYPSPDEIGTELSFEELRAAHRGWLDKSWDQELDVPSEPMSSEPAQDSNSNMGIETVTQQIPEKLVIARDSVFSDENRPEKFAIARDPVPTDENRPAKLVIARDPVYADENRPEKLVVARDSVYLDENGAKKEHNRETKHRRMKVKEVNKTQIISAKLSSPTGKKMKKRKASKEQTMTLHTKAATDEIYDIFNQPLKAASEEEEEEEEESDDDDEDMTDGDYTSGGESTMTGGLNGTSEAGDDDETTDVKSESEWTEFTAQRPVPDTDDEDGTIASTFTDGEDEEFEAIKVAIPRDVEEHDDLVTPISEDGPFRSTTSFVPIPPEDYDPPTHPYRDPAQVSQNRLPFMTPIVERTESSLGLPTIRDQKHYFNSTTSPSRGSGSKIQVFQDDDDDDDDEDSSPLREIVNEAKPIDRIPQPQLGKKKPLSNSTAFAKEIAPKGPIVHDSQCNPVDESIRQLIFEKLQPPLSSYEGFSQHDEARGQSAELKKYAKAASRAKGSSDRTSISAPPTLEFSGTDRQYTLKRELGAGAFAPVYLLESGTENSEQDENETPAVMGKGAFDHFNRKSLEALKMEDPPSAWEFYIMRQAKRRLGVSRPAESIIDVYEMHLYRDECYLIEEYRDQGTLLDIINISRADAKSPGGVMDELLVMFFTIELFRTIEALHSKGILHGDLKADNCLVRFDSLSDSDNWSPKYKRDGSEGWNKKGIALIDFGRGIDMKCFKPDVQFIADWKTGPQDCAEMRELRPWTYQIDYHGLAGIIHSMLFGKYIDTIAERPNDSIGGMGGGGLRKWKIKEGLKRYWQTEIWAGVFDILLNPQGYVDGEEGGKLPVLRGMRVMREEMEEWLEGNCEKGAGLLKGVKKLEDGVRERAKRR